MRATVSPVSVVHSNEREIVQRMDGACAGLIEGLKDLVNVVSPDLLYKRLSIGSVAESILRGAGAIEQTCGGLVSNLWDDPFEWTLPETLSSKDRIFEYLSEVDNARKLAFASIRDDDELRKYVALPSGESRPLMVLLLQMLLRASEQKGKAVVTVKMLSSEGTTRFII